MGRRFPLLPLLFVLSLALHAAAFLFFPGFRETVPALPQKPAETSYLSLIDIDIWEPGPPPEAEPVRRSPPVIRESPAEDPAGEFLVVDEILPPEDASFPTEPAAPAAPENPGPRQAALLPAASPGPAPSERPALIADYARHNFEYIRRRIRDKLVYPPRARRTGAQGRAEIVFTIHPDGSVSGVGIGVSSGQDILDRAIIDAIYAAAPFPPPPFQAKLAVPITFRLR